MKYISLLFIILLLSSCGLVVFTKDQCYITDPDIGIGTERGNVIAHIHCSKTVSLRP